MSLFHSIDEIHHNVRESRRSCLNYTQTVIDELDSYGRELQAVRFTDAEFAMEQADAIDWEQASAAPLAGVPLAHKELFERIPQGREAWLSEGGSASCEGRRSQKTAFVLGQLDLRGAIDCGRLVSVEYALGVTGHNDYAGTPHNPWQPDYICGGSSSGSAACVAAGIIPAALGSDTGGSVRLPAAACGLVGLKPSYGLVSRSGVFELSSSLDTVGPLSRSVRDCALMLDAISGYDGDDHASISGAKRSYLDRLGQPVSGLKLALATEYFLTGADSDIADRVVSCFEAAEGWGMRLSEIAIPDIEATNPLNILMISSEAADVHKDRMLNAHDVMNEQTILRILTGIYTSAEDRHRLAHIRADITARAIDMIFSQTDFLITPVWPFALPKRAESDVGASPQAAPLMRRIGHNTRPFNFLGLPCIVVPVGFDRNGLPLSIQLVGKPYSEPELLQLAWQFEAHFRFWYHRPKGQTSEG